MVITVRRLTPACDAISRDVRRRVRDAPKPEDYVEFDLWYRGWFVYFTSPSSPAVELGPFKTKAEAVAKVRPLLEKRTSENQSKGFRF